MTIGERIKLELVRRNLSQRQLAKLIECEPATISNYVINRVAPKLDLLMKISEVLQLPLDYLVYGKESEFYGIQEPDECYICPHCNKMIKIKISMEKYEGDE